MDASTKGAWLLSQSRSLDAVTGVGRLENIQYAGRIGRLYNLLRRNIEDESASVLGASVVTRVCQLNGIDRSAREAGLNVLQREGRIDISMAGDVNVIGVTSRAVLETTAAIFDGTEPTREEQAVLQMSERIADSPAERTEAVSVLSDEFKLTEAQVSGLVDLCKSAGIVDEAEDRGFAILFNNNTFRDGEYAKKAYRLMRTLTPEEQRNLQEVQDFLRARGAILDKDASRILGEALYGRLIGVGILDRLEVSNTTEAVGYITSPDDFQRFGRPFEEDPIDDAKALLASLTYGMTRSNHARGSITMPDLLLRKLIAGAEVGGRGVQAIGEDYRELEKRQVLQVIRKGDRRYTMKLLKRDVGELALSLVRGQTPAHEALLMDGAAAKNFRGPSETRRSVREKRGVIDAQFMTNALESMRSGI